MHTVSNFGSHGLSVGDVVMMNGVKLIVTSSQPTTFMFRGYTSPMFVMFCLIQIVIFASFTISL